jgi:hypothetical protein
MEPSVGSGCRRGDDSRKEALMTRLALLLAASALLAVLVPGGAVAKEIADATVCGASGCNTLTTPPAGLTGGDNTPDGAPAVGPYYTVTFRVEEQGRDLGQWSVFWIPSASMVAFRDEAGNTTFDRADETTLAAFTAVTKGIEPFEMPDIVGAKVDGEPVADPSSYLGLFGRPSDPTIFPDASDWQPVELTGTRPSPWTDDILVMVSPQKRIVEVGGTGLSHLSQHEAAAITARAALPIDESGIRWGLVILAAAAAVAAVACLVLVARSVRRSVGTRRRPPEGVSLS